VSLRVSLRVSLTKQGETRTNMHEHEKVKAPRKGKLQKRPNIGAKETYSPEKGKAPKET
jgi:hypothetical protein